MQIVEFKVDTTLPILNGNFEALKQSLSEHLVKYEIEVNEANFTEAEQMEREINKLIKQIDGKRKEIAADVKKPIDFFNAKCKELTELCEQSLTKIKSQTESFKQKRQEEWIELLKTELLSQYSKLNIKNEFKTVSILDLVIKSNFTDIGNLAKSARDAISERVHCALSLQNLVHVRLVELENASLKAGLKSPLNRGHVESFLKTDDETYKAQLNKILENEIRRQKEIEAQILFEEKKKQEIREAQIRAEEENKRKVEIETVRKEATQKVLEEQREIAQEKIKEIHIQAEKTPSELKQDVQEKPATPDVKSANGRNIFLITVVCRVETINNADSTKKQFLERLERAKVKDSIQDITIVRGV